MRRFLVVGCGGSGGATLAYMMDQLRSELAAVGVDRIPAGWQFVHLDVPSSPSPTAGLGTVRDQGGTYVGTGPGSDSYKVLDNALSSQLANNGALGTTATWAPRDPEAVHVPLSTGAGQYRGLGRMITLSKVAAIREELQRAWDKLYATSTDTEMKALSGTVPGAGPYYSADLPIVLVVSSMAGGAGASMALDVCRVLTMVSGVDPKLMGVFMVAPDIFDTLAESAITGVRANALAMLGEIVASQTGAAREHDVTLLRAFGLDNGEGEPIPFARVFPVGRFVGAERTVFGDGTPAAVYRGLGRGLSALILSASATQQFVEWDLTNGGGVAGNREFLGWGNAQWNNLPWGTFGFASLSMGRDRYAEYAAQRLARAGVDKLLRGHHQLGSTASDEEQVNAILDNQWMNIARDLGLPDATAPTTVGSWIASVVLPPADVAQLAANVVNGDLRPYMPQNSGVAATQWVARVRQVLAERREQLRGGAQQAAYSVGFHWQQYFVARLEYAAGQALAQRGMPYATGLIKRVQRTLQDVVLPGGQDLAKWDAPDVGEVAEEARPLLASLKGTLTNPSATLEKVLGGTRSSVETQIYTSLAEQIAKASAALIDEVLKPLVDALDESQRILRQAAAATAGELGLAHLQTNDYAAWPSDLDETVAARFSEADNEVMLTSSADFRGRYEIDLPQSVGVTTPDRLGMEQGIAQAVAHVVTGSWETVGGIKAPAEERLVIERTSEWRSKAFPNHPDTREGLIAQPARYDVHVRPPELLARARRFVARPGESFERFTSLSLRDYVTGSDAPESELAKRQQDLVIKFGEAIDLARPLASVNENAMQALHGVAQMVYRYKFSSIPFRDMRVAEALVSSLADRIRVDSDTADTLRRALSDEGRLKKIDIFGSYPNYSPLAYTSVVEPAAKQWLAASPAQRKAFWSLRRARPLSASLPMHSVERRIMVAGWILGRAIGFIQQPTEPYTQPAYVWDTEGRRWLAFPNPLLTPPAEFKADYDWLPAVLEGSLIAIAQSHQPPVMTSLHPYRALRRIYDDSPEDPVSGLHTLAAKNHMTRWLRTGNAGSGKASAIAGADGQVGVDDRARLLEGWLREFNDFAGRHYMAPGEGGGPGEAGAPGGGTFSVIGIRQQASAAPIFRDVAPDVFWATRQLLGLVPECVENAKRPDPETSSVPQSPPTGPVGNDFGPPQPGATFEVPKGGNF